MALKTSLWHPGIPRPSQTTSSTDPGHPSSSCPSPAQPQAFLGAAAGFTTLLAMHLLISVAETDLDLRGVAGWVETLVTWQGGQNINVLSWENHPEIW